MKTRQLYNKSTSDGPRRESAFMALRGRVEGEWHTTNTDTNPPFDGERV